MQAAYSTAARKFNYYTDEDSLFKKSLTSYYMYLYERCFDKFTFANLNRLLKF